MRVAVARTLVQLGLWLRVGEFKSQRIEDVFEKYPRINQADTKAVAHLVEF